MSERNFSRRRRGMRFRPSGGLGHVQKPDREAVQARADATGEINVPEKVFEHRHSQEIERAENLAAGLPPEGVPAAGAPTQPESKRDFREPNPNTPAEVQEEKFQP